MSQKNLRLSLYISNNLLKLFSIFMSIVYNINIDLCQFLYIHLLVSKII